MSAIASPGSFTNSGMFAARSGEVKRSSSTGGLSFPLSSIWVRKSCVYGPFTLEEKTSQRLFDDQLCQEFMRAVLWRRRRARPPRAGTIHSSLSGCSSM